MVKCQTNGCKNDATNFISQEGGPTGNQQLQLCDQHTGAHVGITELKDQKSFKPPTWGKNGVVPV